MHFKSKGTILAKSANEKNPFGRRKVPSAEYELRVDHITIKLAIRPREKSSQNLILKLLGMLAIPQFKGQF